MSGWRRLLEASFWREAWPALRAALRDLRGRGKSPDDLDGGFVR